MTGEPLLQVRDLDAAVAGFQVTDDVDLEQTLRRAIDESGVSIIDCPMDYSINELLETDLYGRAQEAHGGTDHQD